MVRARAAHAAAGRDWNSAQTRYTMEWRDAVNRIASGDPDAIEAGIVFLEVNPWCLFSGYEKDRLYRALGDAPLAKEDQARLRPMVLEGFEIPGGHSRVTLRALAHPANAVWTPALHRSVSEIERSPNSLYREQERLFLHHAAHGHRSSVRWASTTLKPNSHRTETDQRRTKPVADRRLSR